MQNAVWLMPCRWLQVLDGPARTGTWGQLQYPWDDKDMDMDVRRVGLRNIRTRPHIPVKTSFSIRGLLLRSLRQASTRLP